MINGQMGKYLVAIAPAAVVNNATATATAVDCSGANYAEVIVQLGATDVAMAAFKLQECDTADGVYTDILGADFATGKDVDGSDLSLPSAESDNQTIVFQCDLIGKKRFLKVQATFGNGSTGGFVSAVVRLSNNSIMPHESTEIASGGVCRI